MTDQPPKLDSARLEALNRKAIENQFFTPDNIYVELSLFKDWNIGALYLPHISNQDQTAFEQTARVVNAHISDYQTRVFDTISPFFDELGVGDETVAAIVEDYANHNSLFLLSPNTMFLQMLQRHLLRNQNNSKPAHKFTKHRLDKDHYVLKPVDITLRINTFPLVLSQRILERFSQEVGETLGVNITFMYKDPAEFDQSDWDSWLAKTECLYVHDLGRFHRSVFVRNQMAEMEMAGKFLFGRKRFDKAAKGLYNPKTISEEFETEIQIDTAVLSFQTDFTWIPNNDLRLTKEPIVVKESDTLEVDWAKYVFDGKTT